MTSVASDPIASWARYLADRNGLKVWSVIVTVLGDLAQTGPEAYLRGPDLTAILTRIGLQPDAIRVALHRLRRDGWITSTKEGRVSHLRLSPRGLAETQSVSDRVFGPMPPACDIVIALTNPSADETAPAPGIALRRGVYLACADNVNPDAALTAPLSSAPRPDWLTDLPLLKPACTEFETLSKMVEAVPSDLGSVSPLDQTALRTLVLHGWRRALLRTDPVAEHLLGANIGITPARRRVLACLNQLPRNFEALTVPAPQLQDQQA